MTINMSTLLKLSDSINQNLAFTQRGPIRSVKYIRTQIFPGQHNSIYGLYRVTYGLHLYRNQPFDSKHNSIFWVFFLMNLRYSHFIGNRFVGFCWLKFQLPSKIKNNDINIIRNRRILTAYVTEPAILLKHITGVFL